MNDASPPSVNDLEWAVTGPPVGTWTTSNGTFDGMMQDTLTLAHDGTGWLLSHSAMQGTQLLPVMWRHPEPGCIELTALRPDDDPQEDPFYERIRYAPRVVEFDVGRPQVVLQNTDDEVFCCLAGPIALRSRVPLPPPDAEEASPPPPT